MGEGGQRVLLCDLGWRQLSFVTGADHAALAEVATTTAAQPWHDDGRLCVISQDCDLDAAEDREPLVDLLIGRPIDALKPDNTQNRNPRQFDAKLLLAGQEQGLRFQMYEKLFVKKSWFVDRQPDAAARLSDESAKYIRFWLRDRYVRTALPNALVQRIAPQRRRLAKALRQVEGLRLFASYSPRDELHDAAMPYQLELRATYDERTADARACEAAYIECVRLLEACAGIELIEGEVLPEKVATIADLRDSVKFGYEYLSTEGEPPGEAIEQG